MSVKHERQRIRLGLDVRSFSTQNCAITGQPPALWRGTDVQIEVALIEASLLVDDLTNLSKICLNITPSGTGRSGAPLLNKEVLAADFETITLANWNTGAEDKYQVLFELSNAETQFDFTSASDNKRVLHLVVYAVTNDEPERYITCGIAQLTVYEDGALNGGITEPVTAAVTRISDAGRLQIKNPETEEWHNVDPVLTDGYLQLLVDQDAAT